MTAAPVLARTLRYRVTVSLGGKPGPSSVFDKSIVTIGRGPENDLVFGHDSRMSRVHAELRLQAGQLIVRNVSQKNVLLVDGQKIEEKTLTGAATLQIGETTLKVELESEASPVQLVRSEGVAKPLTVASAAGSSAAPRKQNFGNSPPPPPPRGQAMPASVSGNDSGRLIFYLILAGVLGLGFWLYQSGDGVKKAEVKLRTEGDVVRAIEESAQTVQEIRKKQEAEGKDSLQYKSAQEHYIKGFRDYRQGQYARAMQSFQAALSFYPNHELARKYFLQSQRRFEAQIDLNMSQGRKYHQKHNYRMCQSSFLSVMMMVKDSTKQKYREAKQLYDECSLYVEGKY